MICVLVTSITIPTCPYFGLYHLPVNCTIDQTVGVCHVGCHFASAFLIH
ncbi:hypothetical protein HOF65_05800 [bacterium]|nr:hypothetical protein [bacterium]